MYDVSPEQLPYTYSTTITALKKLGVGTFPAIWLNETLDIEFKPPFDKKIFSLTQRLIAYDEDNMASLLFL